MPTEDHFTQATSWCPSPGLWHADDGDATEHEVTGLVAAFVRALQPEVVAETGAYTGQTSAAIGQALLRNGHGRLHTVEIDPERAALARARCAGLPVDVVCGNSLDWDAPAGIDFAWVDGGPDRVGELCYLLPRFAPGAVLGMHDMGPLGTFRKQLEPMVRAGQLVPVVLRTPRGVMFAELHP